MKVLDENTQSEHLAPYHTDQMTRMLKTVVINEVKVQKFIKPVQTEWATSVVFTIRKVDTLHFCVKYHRPNAVTNRDAYPILRMEEYIDSLGKATTFSALAMYSRVWQVEI